MKNAKKLDKRKLTALIPGHLIDDMHELANGKNLTESVIIMMSDWTKTQRLKKTFDRIKQNPLEFTMTAEEIRKLNRNR